MARKKQKTLRELVQELTEKVTELEEKLKRRDPLDVPPKRVYPIVPPYVPPDDREPFPYKRNTPWIDPNTPYYPHRPRWTCYAGY